MYVAPLIITLISAVYGSTYDLSSGLCSTLTINASFDYSSKLRDNSQNLSFYPGNSIFERKCHRQPLPPCYGTFLHRHFHKSSSTSVYAFLRFIGDDGALGLVEGHEAWWVTSVCMSEIISTPRYFVFIDFARVGQIPSSVWRRNPSIERRVEGSRWFTVGAAFVWLLFFGYTSDTRRLYGPYFRYLGRYIYRTCPKRDSLQPLQFVPIGSVVSSDSKENTTSSSNSTGDISTANVEDIQVGSSVTP